MVDVRISGPAESQPHYFAPFNLNTGIIEAETGHDLVTEQGTADRLAELNDVTQDNPSVYSWQVNPLFTYKNWRAAERQVQDITQQVNDWQAHPVKSKIKCVMTRVAFIAGAVFAAALTVGAMLAALGIFGAVPALASFGLVIGSGVLMVGVQQYIKHLLPKLPPSLSQLQQALNNAEWIREQSYNHTISQARLWDQTTEQLREMGAAYEGAAEGEDDATNTQLMVKAAANYARAEDMEAALAWLKAQEGMEALSAPVSVDVSEADSEDSEESVDLAAARVVTTTRFGRVVRSPERTEAA